MIGLPEKEIYPGAHFVESLEGCLFCMIILCGETLKKHLGKNLGSNTENRRVFEND